MQTEFSTLRLYGKMFSENAKALIVSKTHFN